MPNPTRDPFEAVIRAGRQAFDWSVKERDVGA
jgi:hypothetical protein